MKTRTTRKIVRIDEDKCNGCGLCVPNCAEGAIQIIDGKARLVAENLCDGLGNCLGKCPLDAIHVEERPADEFDEQAVHKHMESLKQSASAPAGEPPAAGGCPGSMMRMLKHSSSAAGHAAGAAAGHAGGCPGAAARMLGGHRAAGDVAKSIGPMRSELGHWPVQLALVPVKGAMWTDADVLIAADCVAFAMPDFHSKLLAGRSVAIACPKLDDVEPYIEKLTLIFAGNTIRSITIAHMEVPCCSGIVRVVREAIERSGRNDIPVQDVTVGIDGSIS